MFSSERTYDRLKIKVPKMLIWKEAETKKWDLKNKMGDKMVTTEKPVENIPESIQLSGESD